MGRTNPTFRDLLRQIESRWSDYRRALRHPTQPHFDQLFEYARKHSDASGYLNHEHPMNAVLVSIVLEQEQQIATLEERIDTLETRDDTD